jgi:hypothetical protein
MLLRRFGSFQNGRPPTTPLDCGHSEESTGAIRESPRCSVTELFVIEDCTRDSDLIWFNLLPVPLEGNDGCRGA